MLFCAQAANELYLLMSRKMDQYHIHRTKLNDNTE